MVKIKSAKKESTETKSTVEDENIISLNVEEPDKKDLDYADQLQKELEDGGSSEGEMSSDDDETEEKKSAPAVNEDALKKARSAAKTAKKGERGVIYLGRIPRGFYEDQMRAYFSQFGVVTRLRLSRNKKTGNTKHYAFIEFKHKEVADVVAETMNGYIMFSRILCCKVVPKEKLHKSVWKGANKKFQAVNTARRHMKEYNRSKTAEEHAKNVETLKEKHRKLKQQLEEAGIDYDFNFFEEEKKKNKRSSSKKKVK